MFFARVEKTKTCWNWTGGNNGIGYGRFWDGNRQTMAHRWSYEFSMGEIPVGLSLDHLCRNPSCVNPEHLEPVTMRENIMRGTGVTAQYATKTHCKYGHEFNKSNTRISKYKYGTTRICRICNREYMRKRRLEKQNAA